ncbi:MAG: hypothetical protein HQK68_01445 [Desulfamplus sp.]|nr:hypothetical protein [Desulfamplus sp.]
MYNHNHKTSSWRSFQQTLQRESKQTSRNNIKIIKRPTLNQKGLSFKKVDQLQQTIPTNRVINNIKGGSLYRSSNIRSSNVDRSNKDDLRPNGAINGAFTKKSSPFRKIVISFSIILLSAFIIQQAVPMFVREANSFFTEASAFFKHDVSSFIKQIASSINTKADNTNISDSIAKASKKADYLSKQELKALLYPHSLLNLEDNILTVSNNIDKTDTTKRDIANNSTTPNNRNLTVATTLDMRLQNFLLEQIDSLMMLDRGKPEIIAMVAMEPHTGKILAMAGFDNQSPNTNPCTDKEYPAASLFKLVTASAAVEACGYSPATTMYFSGGKYTLYKRQISEEGNSKYLNKVTLAEAFAQSINPVFGKLGSIMLGRDILEKYASSFGFNQEIDSEINLRSGNFTITDNNSYQWAEVASGFNRTTTISPMFGAMLASTMLNGGKTPVPCIVESVKDDNGKVLYKRKDETLNSNTVKPDTARAMMQMMNGTVITGTARKSFRGVDKDHVLAGLKMGGKTGSLSNSDRSIKFDWFTGFCSDSQEKEQIVVSVLVGHGKYIGTKASIYGRLMFKEYFNNYFALNPKQSSNG